jgi:glucoamylase
MGDSLDRRQPRLSYARLGILNEVYWPSTGLPQILDLGFIVAGPSGWFEIKRINRYSRMTPGLCVPLPEVVHEGPGYRRAIDVVPDLGKTLMLISIV